MVTRVLENTLRQAAGHYPVVTVTGPRQSGKTTLCRATFPQHSYASLEPLDTRAFALEDPRGFLAQFAAGVIIDEVQHAPGLLSYVQADVDRDAAAGRFVLTGSQNLGLIEAVAQSLAGRTAVLHLLPLSLDELQHFEHPPANLYDTLWQGSYPRIHDRGIPADRWLADYVATYVERDVRQVLNIGDLTTFSAFVRLVAGRTAQELNLSSLGSDAGVSHNTARAWLSVMEAGFLCFRAPASHRNTREQMVRSAKVHMVDSGLACHLLGIHSPGQLVNHPQRGAIFESWVAAEITKARVHRGRQPALGHLRQSRGVEVDLVLEHGQRLGLIEVKSGATVPPDFHATLTRASDLLTAAGEMRPIERWLIYGGSEAQTRAGAQVVPWRAIQTVAWADD